MTLTEAARLLGVSRDAIKKRVQRGSLPAYKDEMGAWRIHLPEGDATGDMSGDMSRDRGEGLSPGHVSPVVPTQLTAVMEQWVQPLVNQIATQAEEIGRLRLENEQLKATLSAAERGSEQRSRPVANAAPEPTQRESGASQPLRRRGWLARFFSGD